MISYGRGVDDLEREETMSKLFTSLSVLLLVLGGCSDEGDKGDNGNGDGDDNGDGNDNSDYVERDEDEIEDLGVDNGSGGGNPDDIGGDEEGECEAAIEAIIRDFSTKHPDFETFWGNVETTRLVEDDLGSRVL